MKKRYRDHRRLFCVRPNLLRNACFVGGGMNGKLPINQRGAASYTGGGYAIDMWAMTKLNADTAFATVAVEDDGIRITNAANGNAAYFSQYFSAVDWQDLVGKTITLSALVAEKTGTWYMGKYGAAGKALSVGMNETTLSVTGEEAVRRIQFFASAAAGSSIKVVAVKLEDGEGQTLGFLDGAGVWQLYEKPDYLQTLAVCQRHLLPINNQMRFVATGGATTDVVNAWIPCPKMAQVPVLSGDASDLSVRTYTGAYNDTDASVVVAGTADWGVLLTITGSKTIINQPYSLAAVIFSNKLYLTCE